MHEKPLGSSDCPVPVKSAPPNQPSCITNCPCGFLLPGHTSCPCSSLELWSCSQGGREKRLPREGCRKYLRDKTTQEAPLARTMSKYRIAKLLRPWLWQRASLYSLKSTHKATSPSAFHFSLTHAQLSGHYLHDKHGKQTCFNFLYMGPTGTESTRKLEV